MTDVAACCLRARLRGAARGRGLALTRDARLTRLPGGGELPCAFGPRGGAIRLAAARAPARRAVRRPGSRSPAPARRRWLLARRRDRDRRQRPARLLRERPEWPTPRRRPARSGHVDDRQRQASGARCGPGVSITVTRCPACGGTPGRAARDRPETTRSGFPARRETPRPRQTRSSAARSLRRRRRRPRAYRATSNRPRDARARLRGGSGTSRSPLPRRHARR